MRLTLVAPAATVTASDLDARVLAGVALPYGVPGSTSAGLVSVNAGAVTIPEDLRRVKLFTEHGRQTPIGYTLTADDGAEALSMSFRVAATGAGDEALLEASEGVRDGLSVELDDVVIRAGKVTSARLVAVATTAIPAYADARLVASDTPPDEDPAPVPPVDPDEDDDDKEEDDEMTTAPDPTEARASLPTAGALTAARPATPPGGLVRELSAAFHAVETGRASRDQLFAALADIKWSDTGGVTGTPPQVLGELWKGLSYARRIVPNTSYSTDLDSMTVGGFVWNPTPAVGPYTGNKAAIPSFPAALEWTTFPAQRFAGGNDIDRIHRDFNVPGFWESYWAWMTESYAKLSDKYVLDTIIAGGTPTTAPDVWSALVSAITAIGNTYAAGAGQIKIAISANQLLGLASFTQPNVPVMFQSMFQSLEDLLNTTAPGMPDNTVLVWAQPAVTVKEAGAVPIRAEALNIPNGGIDAALFGYIAAFVTQPLAVQVVTVPAPVIPVTAGTKGK